MEFAGEEQERDSRGRIALRWFLSAAAAAPVAVLSHEMGHFLVFWALGLPEAKLHYSSAGWSESGAFIQFVMNGEFSAAAELAPLWGVAAGFGMGLVATYSVVIACCCLCAKWRAHPLLVALGYLSNLRIVAPVSVFLLDAFGASVRSGCDECVLSMLTSVPLGVLTLPGVIALIWSSMWLARYFPRDQRWTAIMSMVAGMGMGVAVYQVALGPLLLP